MNSIKQGETYTAIRHRTGEDWELIAVKDEKGNFEITLYVSNRPSAVEEGKRFLVNAINGISYGNKQNRNGEWVPFVRTYAEVTPVDETGEDAAPAKEPANDPAENKAM